MYLSFGNQKTLTVTLFISGMRYLAFANYLDSEFKVTVVFNCPINIIIKL